MIPIIVFLACAVLLGVGGAFLVARHGRVVSDGGAAGLLPPSPGQQIGQTGRGLEEPESARVEGAVTGAPASAADQSAKNREDRRGSAATQPASAAAGASQEAAEGAGPRPGVKRAIVGDGGVGARSTAPRRPEPATPLE